MKKRHGTSSVHGDEHENLDLDDLFVIVMIVFIVAILVVVSQ